MFAFAADLRKVVLLSYLSKGSYILIKNYKKITFCQYLIKIINRSQKSFFKDWVNNKKWAEVGGRKKRS